ncbi:hypothetical protein Poli38472_014350 [Pythium oligandrum]|uniref:Centrosomal protein of 135 kDa n=1 Tax=Pythium oligandrum TaxID=41045 RepID=A0A8K1C849_PYTOL|nr:hypothetical protein Poli38472_014350 [Pythium oligandrum]|eukprot:TMW57747.1 hypothetical protein Poli38472_014350 [Pythium oligandrum]
MANLPSFGQDVTDTVDIRTYGELQTRLRALQYTEPVGVDSVPLVKRLLSDVVRMSEARERVEKELEVAQREAIELSQIILPLRKENAKLTRENNSLHLEIIHQEESISEREQRWELEMDRLKDEFAQLRFVNAQQTQTLMDKEREMEKLHAQLERIMSTDANKTQPSLIEIRGGGLRASSKLPTSPTGASGPARADDAAKDAALIADLQKEVKDLTLQHKQLSDETKLLREKLQNREKEIERLAKLTVDEHGDRRLSASIVDESTELQIEQLTTQVDILNTQVAKYETRLKSANEQIRHNTALEQALRNTEKLNEQLQRDLSRLQARYHMIEEENMRLGSTGRGDEDARQQSSHDRVQAAEGEGSGEISVLQEQVATLAAQKDRLEDALRATHYDKVSFTNALSNANSHNRVLSSDLARSESKAKEMSQGYTKAQQSLADANARLEAQAREIDVLREGLKSAEQTRALESEKNAALHRELRSMDKVLHEREEECRTLNQTLAIQRNELERITHRLESLKKSVESEENDAIGEHDKQGKTKAMYAQEMKWLEEERQELRQSKEDLMRQVVYLEERLHSTRLELQSLEVERDELQRKLQNAAKTESNLQSMLDTKKNDYLTLQRDHLQWKERTQQAEEELQQVKIQLKRSDQVENEKLHFQNESLELKRRVEELRDQNASLQNSWEVADQHVKRLTVQLQELQNEVTDAEHAKNTAEKENLELKKNYDSANIELRNVRQLCNHYQSEFEKLSNELSLHQHSLTTEQSALQTSQTHLSDLKAQIRQLQSELMLKQNALLQAETRLEQERVQHKTVQSHLMFTQDELQQLKEVRRSLEINLKQVREDMRAREKTLTEKTETTENLKLLIEQMEASREQMMFKLKQEQQQNQRQYGESEDLHTRLHTAEQEVHAKQAEITSLKKLTRTLDAEKDQVHDQLDALTEKYHELTQQYEKLQQDHQYEASGVRDLQDRMGQLVTQLNAAEGKNKELEVACRRFESELDSVRHTKAMSDAELKALAQDLENMTIENQALSEECTRLQYTCQKGDHSTSTLKQRVRDAEKERDILNVELEDLQHTYRALIQEYEGLQKAHTQTAQLLEESTVTSEASRRQATSVSNEIDVLRQKNLTLMTEAAAYRDQISFLTEKLRSAEDVLGESDHQQAQLRNELEAQKQVAQEISAQRYDAQAQNAAVAQRIVHLEAKLSNTQFEVKTLQEKLQAEMSQRRNVEDVVVTLRQQIAAKDATIEHLEEQRDVMAQEIRSNHQRLVAADMMDMSELLHTPPNVTANAAHRHSGVSNASRGQSRGRHSLRADSEEEVKTPDSMGAETDDGSSILPIRALQQAQLKCKELEDRLMQQDETIKNLERSRSKFKRFAAKYEREIETRDRMIDELKSSHASSSFVSPPTQLRRSAHSDASSSSSSSSSAHRRREGVDPRR